MRVSQGSKPFFFEKKNQKAFAPCRRVSRKSATAESQAFCFFLQKRRPYFGNGSTPSAAFGQARKQGLLFREKEAKSFYLCELAAVRAPQEAAALLQMREDKSFLVLFFKKGLLASPGLTLTQPPQLKS